jgi:hypothetical protein
MDDLTTDSKTTDMPAFDEAYVHELLEAAKRWPRMSRREFQAFCRLDLNARYETEVEEAERRYFAAKPEDR